MSDGLRQDLLARAARVAIAAVLGAVVVAAASLLRTTEARANADGCQEVYRVLSNGNPLVDEGAVSVRVDGLGAFGSQTASGDAVFNPAGTLFNALGTVKTSHVYLNTAGRMLVDDCFDGQVEVVDESPLHTRITVGSVRVDVVQELAPVTLGGSTLTQTYTFTSLGEGDVDLTFVRHVDGELAFDSPGVLDGAAALSDGETLFQIDSASSLQPRAFLGLAGALDGEEIPARWTIQPYDYKPVILGANGIPAGDDGEVHNDLDEDLEVDTPFDVTLSQQWDALDVGGGDSVTLQTVTRFDAENRDPVATADAPTARRDQALDIDVRANDSDPDGDPLSIDSVTQPANGTVSVNANGTLRYTPVPGFAGADGFTYTVGDGRGGFDVAAVSVTVLDRYALTVSKTGDGTVRSTPAGIDCGAVCTATFEAGTSVTLTPVPAAGWTFGGWSGACSGLGACTVVMDGPKSVTAGFLPPAPIGGQNANVEPTRGIVLVREPGSNVFVPLRGADQIPLGSQLDTTAGAVEITMRRGAARDTSEFYEGVFTITQANANAVGEMRLGGGDFLQCLTPLRTFADRRPVRRLWGSGRGRFRTRGRYSSASVRGTKWVTEDACGGTLTRVEEGSVTVFDSVRRVNVVVTAGRRYFAEPLPRGVRSAGCTVIGTAGRDVLRGTPRRDVLCGLGGNDVLIGRDGRDHLLGGSGSDRLLGGGADDLLEGGNGNDYLDGGDGHDVLKGGRGSDFMIALDGGRGNDRVAGGGGIDRCRTDWIRICP